MQNIKKEPATAATVTSPDENITTDIIQPSDDNVKTECGFDLGHGVDVACAAMAAFAALGTTAGQVIPKHYFSPDVIQAIYILIEARGIDLDTLSLRIAETVEELKRMMEELEYRKYEFEKLCQDYEVLCEGVDSPAISNLDFYKKG